MAANKIREKADDALSTASRLAEQADRLIGKGMPESEVQAVALTAQAFAQIGAGFAALAAAQTAADVAIDDGVYNL